MCKHDTFRHFCIEEKIEGLARAVTVRVCVDCHKPEIILSSNDWLPMKEITCPTNPPA